MSDESSNGGMVKVRRVDFYPADWLTAVIGELTLVEQGLYWLICSLIYARGGPIEYDVKMLTKKCAETHGNTVDRALKRLIALGKVTPIQSQSGLELTVKRCQFEIEKALKRTQSAIENGAKGGRGYRSSNDLTEPGANRAVSGSLKLSTSTSSSTSDSSTNPVRDSTPRARTRGRDTLKALLGRLVAAMDGNVEPGPGIDDIEPIVLLMAEQCDLERDILPALAELAQAIRKPLRTWRAPFVADAILAARDERLARADGAAGAPAAMDTAAQEKHWRNMVKIWVTSETWHEPWGPQPRTAGCPIPEWLIAEVIAATPNYQRRPPFREQVPLEVVIANDRKRAVTD